MRNRASERGMTLIEMLVVVAISTVVMIAAYEMMDGAVQASLYVEAHNDLPVFGQEVVNLLQREMMQSREFFPATAAGEAYRSALRTSGGVALTTLDAPGSLLPIADTGTQVLIPDDATTGRLTGNCLLIARQLEPLLLPFDHDNDNNTADVQFPADRYEFQYYYLTRNTARNFSNSGYILDLVQARSVTFADYFQLVSLSGTQRAELAPQLIAAGLTRAWNPSTPIANAFYNIQAPGTFQLVNNPTITMNRIRSVLPAFGAGGRISGFMNYTVGICRTVTRNCNTAASQAIFPGVRDRMPQFALVDNNNPAFPQGLEFKIVGPAGSRKAFVRLVLMAHYGVTKFDSSESVSLTSVNF
jgi:prepilin-type N-terminal cleavage/methylation domain-containing protein